MILLLAILAGFLAGWLRAFLNNSPFQPLQLRHIWLAPLAVVPQILIFNILAGWENIPYFLVSGVLVITMVILLVFVAINLNTTGFRLICMGLSLNFLVITLNGGMMPISPETVSYLAPHLALDSIQPGLRYLGSKDIILLPEETHLWLLSDIFLSPEGSPWKFAFSFGDVFIALGAFWSLCAQGGVSKCLVANPQGRGKFSATKN